MYFTASDHQPDPAPRPRLVLPSERVWVGGHHRQARRLLEKHLTGVTRPSIGSIDAAFLTPESVGEAMYFARKLRDRLVSNGKLWIVLSLRRDHQHAETSAGVAGMTIADLAACLCDLGYEEEDRFVLDDEFSAVGFSRMGPTG